MSEPIAKVGMTPCHPGEFIREEILHELHLPVTRAAAILGVRRATLSDLVNGNIARARELITAPEPSRPRQSTTTRT
jgi:plasmid maintenance system antidote protein VapI